VADKPVKLRALDAEDLAVISAVLQDAVVALRDMRYLPEEKRFVLVASRFRWEVAPGEHREGQIYERVHSGICFDQVTRVRRRGFGKTGRGTVLSLLAVVSEDSHVDLQFSAGAVIRLEVDSLMCHLEDLDEPWPTQWRPSHALGDKA